MARETYTMTDSAAAERQTLQQAYAKRKNDIKHRLEEFSQVPPSEYFYEMVYCLLTPQSSARNADAVVRILKEKNFAHNPFDAESLLGAKDHYIRFHRTKARRLLRLAKEWAHIEVHLAESHSSPVLREWLVDTVDGFGMKEATHFLRNIGKNDGLAILDRHILRNLVRCGVLARLPASLTRKRYIEIESAFISFAQSVHIPLDELDLLFWSRETGEILK